MVGGTMNDKVRIILESIIYFLGGAIATAAGIRFGIPYLHETYGIAPVFGWFLTSGIVMSALFCRRRCFGSSQSRRPVSTGDACCS
jgi:hypothetical protein